MLRATFGRLAGCVGAVTFAVGILSLDAPALATTPPSGPTTTLLQIELPAGATTKPPKSTKPLPKKRTTTQKRPAKTAPTSVALTNAPDTEVPSTAGGKVVVDTAASAVPPGKGVDPTITTLLAPDKVPNAIPEATWLALRQCESHNNYEINTGNGYYGAYQFAAGTWKKLGYSGLPHRAAPAVQDEAAKVLQAKAGWGQWPACSRKLGLR